MFGFYSQKYIGREQQLRVRGDTCCLPNLGQEAGSGDEDASKALCHPGLGVPSAGPCRCSKQANKQETD